MLDANDLDLLAAIADAGSMSAAARKRGVAVSTVARRIDILEAVLKLRLLDRRADGVRLTEAGARIAGLARPLADQIARVVRTAEALRAEARGQPVRISATEFVISDVLAPALPRLGAHFPVHLQVQADLVSLAGRDADLAIRMVRPDGASLMGRKLAELRGGWFAAPRWLDGRDPALIDLAAAPLLMYDDSYGRLPELAWLRDKGLMANLVMRTASTRALLSAAMAGAGVAYLPMFAAGREPGLVRVPAPAGMPVRTPWLIVHRDLRRLPDIRQTMRWIVETFAATLRGAG